MESSTSYTSSLEKARFILAEVEDDARRGIDRSADIVNVCPTDDGFVMAVEYVARFQQTRKSQQVAL